MFLPRVEGIPNLFTWKIPLDTEACLLDDLSVGKFPQQT